MHDMITSFTLNNGITIPSIGYGTWQVENGPAAVQTVAEALRIGYRHIDTATCYGNEKSVGEAIARSGLDRRDLFVTSKVWNTDRGYDSTLKAFERSLSDLGLDYLDLYLIHWPKVAGTEDRWEEIIADTWRAFEELYKAGRVRAIGVSNFLVHHLEVLERHARIMPHVDQIELNPTYQQRETVSWCEEQGIQLEAWAPLGRGRLMRDEHMLALAERLGKDAGQVCVRWALQKGFITMPKSTKLARIKSNSEVFDFELSSEDMALLDSYNTDDNYTFHPDRLAEWAERVAAAHRESGV